MTSAARTDAIDRPGGHVSQVPLTSRSGAAANLRVTLDPTKRHVKTIPSESQNDDQHHTRDRD